MAGLLILIPIWLVAAFNPPERCSTSEPTSATSQPSTSTSPSSAPAPPMPPTTSGPAPSTAPTSASASTPAAGTGPTTRTCQPAGLTDPPLAIPGLMILLLAIPVLGLSEVGFAGLTVKRSAEKAEAAAKEATSAAQQAAAAASSLATARASSRAAGNVVMFGGASREPKALDAGLAFTFAVAGVVAFIRDLPGVTDASVLWFDPATSSLRPSGGESAGEYIDSELGQIVRRSIDAVVKITDGRPLGLLATEASSSVLALPTRQPPGPAVGVVLAVLSDPKQADVVRVRAEKAVKAAALHIIAFTTAGTEKLDRSYGW